MFILFRYLLFQIYIFTAESRVHCEDTKATQWTPLGFSCPVNCANVINAINRLKTMDDEKISNDKNYENEIAPFEDYIDNWAHSQEKYIRKYQRVNYKETTNSSYESVVAKSLDEIHRRMATNTTHAAGKCFKYYKSVKGGLLKCVTRRGYDAKYVIQIIAETMTRYTGKKIAFGVTKKLLTSMFGEEKVRTGDFDLKAVVEYLSHAFYAYQDMKGQKQVIRLTSQHCFTTYVPGCFCRPGFVEHFGRCLRPAHCALHKSEELKYMNRIIVV